MLLLFFSAISVAYGTHSNTLHWLWGGSTNDLQGGPSLETATGVGWISLTSNNPTGSSIEYGVTIPTSDGPVTGYAWSSNLGWIDFNPTGPYPAPPNTGAIRNGDNLRGWARIMSIADAKTVGNSGGWDGWIKLKGNAGDLTPYGVTLVTDANQISPFDNRFQGHAWSNELGWISFGNDASTNPPLGIVSLGNIPPPGLTLTCSGSPNPVTLSNGLASVAWTAFASNGVQPYTYIWNSLGGGSPNSGSGPSINTEYNSIGTKTADVMVTDSTGEEVNGVCEVQVNGEKDFDIKEIIPFF
ncbi:MAG: hypothetical protein AAB407_01445 [Patescibacteria group bacterium]